MRILILAPQPNIANPLARLIAKKLNLRSTTSIEQFVNLNFGPDRIFFSKGDIGEFRSAYKNAELNPVLNVVVGGGIIRYILIRLYYIGEIDRQMVKLLREIYQSYDYVVYLIPKIIYTNEGGIRKKFADQFTGPTITVLGNIDRRKLILENQAYSKINLRADWIIKEIMAKENM